MTAPGRIDTHQFSTLPPGFHRWKTCRLAATLEVGVVGRSGMTGNTFHAKEFLPGGQARVDGWLDQIVLNYAKLTVAVQNVGATQKDSGIQKEHCCVSYVVS